MCPVANVQIKGAGAIPSQCLIGIEELLQVPTLGVVFDEGVQGIVVTRCQETLEIVVGGIFSASLNDLVKRKFTLSLREPERACCESQSNPRRLEGTIAECF